MILAREAREPHTRCVSPQPPSPFLHSLQTFRSNTARVARVRKKQDCFAVYKRWRRWRKRITISTTLIGLASSQLWKKKMTFYRVCSTNYLEFFSCATCDSNCCTFFLLVRIFCPGVNVWSLPSNPASPCWSDNVLKSAVCTQLTLYFPPPLEWLVKQRFVFWWEVVEPKYPWKDQTRLVCHWGMPGYLLYPKIGQIWPSDLDTHRNHIRSVTWLLVC